MIRVLIAEDEPPTLRRLKRMVEETDGDFTVLATAADGEAALAEMEKTAFDVLFTDIRMPVMDGLRLMNEVRTRYADCLIVVISVYQDFAYVSHAIRSQAADYLLKPVSQEAMEELLARIKSAYEKRQKARLSRELSTALNRGAIRRAQTIHPLSAPLGVCLFCAGPYPAEENAEMYPASSFWNDVSLEETLLRAIPQYKGFAWEFMGNTLVERILIYETGSLPPAHIAQSVYALMLRKGGMPVSCACLQSGVPLSGVNDAMRQLRRYLRQRIRIGRAQFLPLDEQAEASEPVDPQLAEHIAQALWQGEAGSAHGFWQTFLARVEREGWTQRRLLAALDAALQLLEGQRDTALQARNLRGTVEEIICAACSLQDVADGFSVLVPLAQEDAAQDAVRHEIISAVEAYLQANYTEHINHQTLATRFGYVPSYISLLFQRTYGVSPSEYLTEIRLRHAKRLMRENPNMLIREVAELVGFKNQHHFSRIFKKAEGMSPSSYQP